jgi:hypothetical protein
MLPTRSYLQSPNKPRGVLKTEQSPRRVAGAGGESHHSGRAWPLGGGRMSERGKPCAQACNSVRSQPIRLLDVFRGAGKVPFSTCAAMFDGLSPTIVHVVSRSTMTGSMCTTLVTRSVPPLGVQVGVFFGRPTSGAPGCGGGRLVATHGTQFVGEA